MSQAALLPELDHAAIVRRGRRLAYWTLLFTAIEAGVALFAGARADSTALLGFGVDSLIEVFSAAVVLWRLRIGERGERREQMALRLVGASLLLLAVYIAFEGIHRLIAGETPQTSYIGMALAVGSLVSMTWLARSKRRIAFELQSGAVQADSLQSEICSYLAAILLVGLALNATLHWWWADPAAALIMVPFIAKEGVEALRGNACGCSQVPHEH